MGFRRFIKTCEKYQFTYALSTYGGLTLVLRPRNTFENITLKQDFGDYRKLFKKAISEMKSYRKIH